MEDRAWESHASLLLWSTGHEGVSGFVSDDMVTLVAILMAAVIMAMLSGLENCSRRWPVLLREENLVKEAEEAEEVEEVNVNVRYRIRANYLII